MKPRVSHPTDRPNFSIVHLNGAAFFFSYETCIAFQTVDQGTVISENVWSRTTGKHLNWIDADKSRRVPHSEFEHKLNIATGTWVVKS